MFGLIRRLLGALITLLLIAAGAGYLLLAHRVTPPSLSYSIATNAAVKARAHQSLVASCEHSRASQWTCSLENLRHSAGGIVYLMDTHGHCWTARLSANFSGLALPVRVKGCVGILDQLRVSDRIDSALGTSAGSPGFY